MERPDEGREGGKEGGGRCIGGGGRGSEKGKGKGREWNDCGLEGVNWWPERE